MRCIHLYHSSCINILCLVAYTFLIFYIMIICIYYSYRIILTFPYLVYYWYLAFTVLNHISCTFPAMCLINRCAMYLGYFQNLSSFHHKGMSIKSFTTGFQKQAAHHCINFSGNWVVKTNLFINFCLTNRDLNFVFLRWNR